MTTKRLVIDVDLQPVVGSTFQPTGFPDLGAATFKRFSNGVLQECLLVESVQSMANRLEATGWHDGEQKQVDAWDGLPYLEVRRKATGEFLTSSRLEAHRIFSAFVRDAEWPGEGGADSVLVSRLGVKADTPLNYGAMAGAIVALDPLSLLHGVFFAGKPKESSKSRAAWPANPKFTRAVTAVIEAHGVERVASGGRKADAVRHTVVDGGGSAEGYGSVPFHRVEFTAETVRASFVVDLALIASYGLPEPVTELLGTLAMWEIRSLLDGGLRLRTACDLEPTSDELAFRDGSALPDLDALTAKLRALVADSAEHLGARGPIALTWTSAK